MGVRMETCGSHRMLMEDPAQKLTLTSTPLAATPPPGPTAMPAPTPTPVPCGSGPLRADGARLVDAAGREVRLTGVNWSGMETRAFAPLGLVARNVDDMLDQIVAAGLNTVRLPYSNQLLDSTAKPMSINFGLNPKLQGLNGLGVVD